MPAFNVEVVEIGGAHRQAGHPNWTPAFAGVVPYAGQFALWGGSTFGAVACFRCSRAGGNP